MGATRDARRAGPADAHSVRTTAAAALPASTAGSHTETRPSRPRIPVRHGNGEAKAGARAGQGQPQPLTQDHGEQAGRLGAERESYALQTEDVTLFSAFACSPCSAGSVSRS